MEIPDAANFEFVNEQETGQNRKVFVSRANSYHGKAIVEHIMRWNSNNYKIYGTFQEHQKNIINIEFLNSNCEDFLPLVTQCDVIILDISHERSRLEQMQMIISYLEENGKDLKSLIILISTIMTWARTANEEIITDLDYRKRRPHPCFHEHFLIERRVLNISKKFVDNLRTMIICPGIIYGEEQDVFQYMFKQCYCNFPEVEIFLPATNFLPIVYIHDFAKIVVKMIENPPQNAQYILAVQPHSMSAYEIVSTLVKESESRIRICDQDEVFTMRDNFMTQRVFNHMTLNLRLESEHLKSNFEFEITGNNFIQHADRILKEFYTSMNLKPIKILIDGSPFTPQSKLAKMLSDHYHLHQIETDNFMDNFKCRLSRKIQHVEENYLKKMRSVSFKMDKDLEISKLIANAENQVKEWKSEIAQVDSLLQSDNALFNDVKDFVRKRLLSQACSKNQGYVMSRFQLDREKADNIFDEETWPDFVIIINRMMAFDQECLEIEERNDENLNRPKKNDEMSIMQRTLKIYYDTQYGDVSLENYFVDLGTIPIEINLSSNPSEKEMIKIFEELKIKIGPRMTLEMSPNEMLEIENIKKIIAEKELVEKQGRKHQKLLQEKEEKEKLFEEMNKQMMDQKKKELQEIERQSLPVREYLNQDVFPHIIDGIREIVSIRPSDPIQYLSNYIFCKHFQENDKNSNDVDMDQDVVNEFEKLTKCNELKKP